MSACVRPYDAPCRYGGEEFLIVLPGCDLADATMRAEEIRRAFSATPFQIPEGVPSVTCSLGVTASSGVAGFDPAALIQEADDALYTAKNNGRNRVEVFVREAVLTR
jgi:diguanylate cyclase (GGDEF)-like protein